MILTAIGYCLLLIGYCLLLIGYCLLLIGYCLLVIGYCLCILTLVALFFGWPLLAGWWWSETESFFTPGGWTPEHVWLGLLSACFVVFATEEGGLVGLGIALLLTWPVLAWAVGSDYTGYALSHAGWTAERIWLGVIAACIAAVIVIAAVRGVIALVRK